MEPQLSRKTEAKVVLFINIILTVLWLVFIFHLLISEWLPVLPEKESQLWWPIGMVLSVIAFAVFNVQITMDIILFKSLLWSELEFSRNLLLNNITHCEKTLEACEHWLKMTTAFEVFQILLFFLSIFYTGSYQIYQCPLFFLIVGVGGIVFRAVGLYLINVHEVELQSSLPPGFRRGDAVFITLSPEFYRSQSQNSVNSIVRCNA